MGKDLIIVESPAKVKTIKKFLGSKYSVLASVGHIRDLPTHEIGVDEEHGFEPRYVTIKGKEGNLSLSSFMAQVTNPSLARQLKGRRPKNKPKEATRTST